MAEPDYQAVFAELSARMRRAAAGCTVATDAPDNLVLHAAIANPLKPKQKMWFGAVQLRKNYVSYHLMPVYSHPALAAEIGPGLKARMQGKSCFNFRRSDAALFDELERLTAKGAELYSRPFTVAKGEC